MTPEKPSQTAAWVALMRAIGTRDLTGVRGFRDPTAAPLLPAHFARAYRAVTWLDEHGQTKLLSRAFTGWFDALPLRTLAIDGELRAALDGGAEQVVILGAGLDGRAWRMPELARATLFEVDHPATQADKRARARVLGATQGEVRYVSVDFEREDLVDRLAHAGHDGTRPTAWIWEGVITYLTAEALRATLGALAARSAPRSRLIAQYQEPPRPGLRSAAALNWMMRQVREPHIGRRPRAVIRSEIERAGLALVSDTGAVDWAERFGSRGELPDIARYVRLAVAELR